MALRLLPYKQYDDKDVVNLYALSSTSAGLSDPSTNGDNDNGVFVKVSAGNLNEDPISYVSSSYLGKAHASPVGRNYLPTVPLKVEAAAAGSAVLGITLNQTLTHDENGEKLIYNPKKKAEMQAVTSGEAVPVATRGIFTITADAVDGSVGVGSGLALSANAGKVTGVADYDSDTVIATVIGTGSRTSSDAGTDGYAGNYFMIKLG